MPPVPEKATQCRVGMAPPDFGDWEALHTLLSGAFAGMDGRIDPPSSLAAMTPANLADKAAAETLVLAWDGDALAGCAFGAPQGDALYLSKIATRPDLAGRGIFRAMLAVLEDAAKRRGLAALTLQTRVELAENHAVFRRTGFDLAGETRHPGYDRTTSLTFRKPL